MDKIDLRSHSRFVVVGTSGSGKSTLARELSSKLNLADIELDALFWEENWQAANQEVFRDRIEAALNGSEKWIVHGNYNKVRDLTWNNATLIIWLDYSRPVVFWRVFKRSVKRIITRERLWAGNRESFIKTFLTKRSIILWSITTYALRREQYQEAMESHPTLKFLVLKRPQETKELLASLD